MKRFSTFFVWLGLLILAVAIFPGLALAEASPAADLALPLLGFAGFLDGPFRTRRLIAAVNQMRPVKTRALDRIFKRKKRSTSSLLGWEIKSSSKRLLKNIRVSEPAQVTDKTGRKLITCEAPRFSEKRFIGADELDEMRKFGDEVAAELLQERIADEQSDMRGDVDRTREFMALKALSGQVVDEAGAVIVDYNFGAEQKPVLAGNTLWTDPAGDPVKNIRAWKKWIADRAAVDGFVSLCGSGVMDALINNQNARELLQYAAGKQIAEEGRIAHLAGVDIDEYFGTYKDAAGAIQQMIPDNVFALVGLGPETTAELYAPVVDLKAAGGVGKGQKPELFFSKAWETEDPSGRWIKVESRPLPVLLQIECIIWAQVI